jgi:hypothetical protein
MLSTGNEASGIKQFNAGITLLFTNIGGLACGITALEIDVSHVLTVDEYANTAAEA